MKVDLSNEELFYEDEINFDKNLNFVFGKNGTGKSTLTKLLKEQGKVNYDVRVFQGFENMIGENNRLNAVILGEENNEIAQEIENMKKDIKKKEEEIDKIDSEIKEPKDNSENLWKKVEEIKRIAEQKDTQIQNFYSKSASEIKNMTNPQISKTTYNKSDFILEKKNAKLLSEIEIQNLKQIIKTEVKIAQKIEFPNINLKDELKRVNLILEKKVEEIYDLIGKYQYRDDKTSVDYIKRKEDGKILKVIDLVDDDINLRKLRVDYLSKLKSVDDLDIIIALGMAKEGFDWAWCEYALTIGYRGSLTEIVQIIGRCTRDSSNKTHAQFTNLIAQPDATQDETAYTVNTFLKAISASLLMEQVLTPDIKFKARLSPDDVSNSKALLFVKGLKEPSTEKSKKIIEQDLPDLRASILSDDDVLKAMTVQDSKLINKLLIPKVIKKVYPDLEDEEIEEIREHIVADNFIKSAEFETVQSDIAGTKEFIKAGNKFVEVEKLDINLIDSVNIFQKAYAMMSRKLDVPTFKIIQKIIDEKRMEITEEEALANADKIKDFYNEHAKLPDINSNNEYEKRLAHIFEYLKKQKARRENGNI